MSKAKTIKIKSKKTHSYKNFEKIPSKKIWKVWNKYGQNCLIELEFLQLSNLFLLITSKLQIDHRHDNTHVFQIEAVEGKFRMNTNYLDYYDVFEDEKTLW